MTAALIISFNSFLPMIYVRKPVKNAPAPSAIIERSKTIHRAKAKILLIFVWLRPRIKQRRPDITPHTNRASHGNVQKKNLVAEHRLAPSGIKAESICFLLTDRVCCPLSVARKRLSPKKYYFHSPDSYLPPFSPSPWKRDNRPWALSVISPIT
jgi:hypothetical protein